MQNTLSFREINLRIFQRQPVPHVFFQPRFEPWYAWHQTVSEMPAAYRGMSLFDLYDDLGVSMRYYHYYTGAPDPIIHTYHPQVNITEQSDGKLCTRIYHTPHGDLTEMLKFTVDETWRTVEFAVKSVDDLHALRWLYEHSQFHFSAEHFATGSQLVGERGEPQFWVPKSPYQALAQTWMKLPHLIYALADAPAEVEQTMEVIDAAYDPLYEEIAASGVVRILNFGENIHEALLSPRYFEQYLIPFWSKRCAQLRQAGIFTHVHMDGYFRSLLKYLRHLPFDGIEALTPTPQGDVELEEMAAAMGEKILLDGIPAVLFMEMYSREELMRFTERLVELFHPRLVLGVSDEVPEGEGMEAIERVRMVADWAKRTCL